VKTLNIEIQDEIFRQVTEYLRVDNITQSKIAIQLGVSKGNVSQILKGEFKYTLKKLTGLSMPIEKRQ
jgi:predicted XRE-type DNA-binding protein